MTPSLIQRHQDYVLGPNQDARLASVAAGQTITGLALHLDTDAPFVLRSRAVRVKYNDLDEGDRLQLGLNHLLARWAGPDRDYRSQNLIRQSLLAPFFGQLGNSIPVHPQIVYPRGGTIWVDITNDGTVALTNLTMYFRGIKLFAPGAVRSYEYPAQLSALPFIYPQGRYSDSDGLTLVRNIQVVQGALRQTFKVKGDADFVIRGGQAGGAQAVDPQLLNTPVNEVFIRLRDEDEKPYSNDAVHIDVMFGNANFGNNAFPAGAGGFVSPVGAGPASMGLFYPEIYVPKNHLFYFDITRDDSIYAGAVPVNLPIQFIGQKVFQK